jgi:TPR repeat protein
MSRAFRALKITAGPLLFTAVALGLATVHISAERKAARAKTHAAHTAAIQDKNASGKLAGVKLQVLAPAAKLGDIPAEVEMARRLAMGEGVKKNEAQAAAYFRAAISQLGDIGAHDKYAPAAAMAYRFMARFHRHGLPEAHIVANPAYAFGLLHHAASYFGDPAAQYEVAKALIRGDGAPKNAHSGAQWLLRAARKGYAPAQAALGEMLWRGKDVKRVPGEGLGLLALARRSALPADKDWISKKFEAARAEALPVEILAANAFIIQESGASPFTTPALGVEDGNLLEGPDADEKGVAAPVQPVGAQQESATHGPTSRLQPGQVMGRGFLALDQSSRNVAANKGGAHASAGVVQMYRAPLRKAADETPAGGASVRVADVAK